jgi:hypothetical protein
MVALVVAELQPIGLLGMRYVHVEIQRTGGLRGGRRRELIGSGIRHPIKSLFTGKVRGVAERWGEDVM